MPRFLLQVTFPKFHLHQTGHRSILLLLLSLPGETPGGAGASPGAAQGGSVPRPGVAGSGARTGPGGGQGGHGPGLGLQLHLVLAVQQLSSASRLRRRDEPRQASVTGLLIASGFVGCGS